LERINKNLIFVTLSRINSLEEHSIYSDLLKCFSNNGYNITIVSPVERRFKIGTRLREVNQITYLDVRTLNIQKTNFFEKGLGTILIKFNYIFSIKKYLSTRSYDLVLYTTPPITFYPVIKYLKLKYKSFCYLLLKDIFPQNAVDLGFIKKNSLLYHYFRNQEIKLYKISDFIGCMSRANLEYILRNNKFLDKKKVEVNPNSISINRINQYDNKKINQSLKLIYGGNLGKPQGIPYLINAIKACSDINNIEFVIAGNGTEDYLVKEWIKNENPKNVTYFPMLPQLEYDKLLLSADIGLICLDKKFTIPNYPSRILSYMEYGMPVICLTDDNTDVGKEARQNGYGYWCLSDDVITFKNLVLKFKNNPQIIYQMGQNSIKYLHENFEVSNSFNIIQKHLINRK
jgi:glycosyltransferase involved in cell wall biosynthesis